MPEHRLTQLELVEPPSPPEFNAKQRLGDIAQGVASLEVSEVAFRLGNFIMYTAQSAVKGVKRFVRYSGDSELDDYGL